MRPVCPNCGYVHYLNPVPTVGVVIEIDGGIVLIQRANPPHQGAWAFPSGYVEADERLEEAAIREAEEETGLKIEIIELADVNSYPEGPPSSGIMIFYRARAIGGELRAGDDALAARVFQPDELPPLPFRTHREVLAQWLVRNGQARHPQAEVPAPEYTVRPATPADRQDIIDLAQMIPANFHLTEADWHDSLLRLRETPSLNVFVAQLNTQPPFVIGCVVLSVARTLTGGVGLINDMAVLPAYRRRGVGAALMEAALRRAAELNLQTLVVNTERASDQTRAFYTKIGFGDVSLLRLKLR